MDVIDLTSPVIEPVSLIQAKLFLRVDHGEEDVLISNMIKAARLQVEAYCGASLIARSRRISFDCAARKNFTINHYPLGEIEAVRLIDKTGQETVLSADQYSSNFRARPGRISLKSSVDVTPQQYLLIDVIAGYGATESDIPAPFIQAILLLLSKIYERGDDRPEDIPLMVQALLMPYRGLRL